MAHINVLSKEISELIAAGEVIERPSSVVKELVENSIDSGARHITVEIKNGGVTYIRVSDDGCGMSYDEVPTAFLRHATSKIAEKADLENILTLGFRGEALASVSAVSRVEVMTKQRSEMYGTMYCIEGGETVSHEQSGCPDGTTIIIRDLFYNVPARRKFMKKDVTEANAVSQILQKITMSHPDIAFKFIRDNKVEFNSSGDGELYSAVYAVYGRDFARDMMIVDHEYQGIRVTGFSGKPLYSRANRSFQNFFVNGRYVRSRLLSSALESSYTNMIMTGKFPTCVLLIELSPADMDVNIHPTKAEVRFTDEKRVVDAVYYAVKNAMVKNGLVYEFELKQHDDWTKPPEKPDMGIQSEFIFTPVSEIAEKEKAMADPLPIPKNEPVSADPAEHVHQPSDEPEAEPEIAEVGVFEAYEQPEVQTVSDDVQTEQAPEVPAPVSIPETKPAEPEEKVEGFQYLSSRSFEERHLPEARPAENRSVWTEKPRVRVIGEIFGVYIIAELDEKTMIMIDKHAAHERIIFERLRSRNCRQYSQMLMTGVKVLLTADEFSALESNTELLADLGFEFDFSERPCATAKAVPTFIMEADMEEIIAEIANNLRLYRHDPQSHLLDDMLHTVACKSAIRGNDKNSMAEMQALAEEVLRDERIRHCPHGRPVMFTVSKSNIEHQFGRT